MEKEPAQTGKKPHISGKRAQPAYTERGGIPKVQTLGRQVRLQIEWFSVKTIRDPDPFLNNGFVSKFDFDSKLVLLVLYPILIEKSGYGFGTGSS